MNNEQFDILVDSMINKFDIDDCRLEDEIEGDKYFYFTVSSKREGKKILRHLKKLGWIGDLELVDDEENIYQVTVTL